MSVTEQVLQKLTGMNEADQKKVLEFIQILEKNRELRAWALEQFTEEEFLAGMEEIKRTRGHRLEDFFPELERRLADGNPSER
jgi:hypothetical protein